MGGSVEVVVFAEGETEERFVKQLIAPALNHLRVYIKPVQLQTSHGARGGAISFDRLAMNARNMLRQRRDVVLTTFFDLYGLNTSFPEFHETKEGLDVYQRVERLEAALHIAIVEKTGCPPGGFIPHIQPYEFEGLLFSDVNALCSIEPGWAGSASALAKARAAVDSPEHVNDSFESKPSARLKAALSPTYRKTTHGPRAAHRVTLEVIERECKHFHQWMNRLRSLSKES